MVTYYCFCPEDPYKIEIDDEYGMVRILLKWLHIDCAVEYQLSIYTNKDAIITILLPFNFIIDDSDQINTFLSRVESILNQCRCIEVE